MNKKLTRIELKQIKSKIPNLLNLLYLGDDQYHEVAISVFDHFLLRNEVSQIFIDDNFEELEIRRNKLESFVKSLFELTKIYLWRYKRHDKIYIYKVSSLKYLQNVCNIQNQVSNTVENYSLIIPEFSCVYDEGSDWTNQLYYKDRVQIKPIIDLVQSSGLHILE